MTELKKSKEQKTPRVKQPKQKEKKVEDYIQMLPEDFKVVQDFYGL